MNNNTETFVADVRRFTEAVGCTTDRFNVRQTALYIGLQLEEMAEKLEAIGYAGDALLVRLMKGTSSQFKSGSFDQLVETCGDREAMLDADIDLAWVTIGSALSQGADVLGAMREVARANLDKIGPDGSVIKDENGKVRKPAGWRGPDNSSFIIPREAIEPAICSKCNSPGLCREYGRACDPYPGEETETSVPAIVFYPAGSLGEPVESEGGNHD